MTWLLDIIIVAIIGISVFMGVKNGFVKTALGAASFIIAVIVTISFNGSLASALKDTSIAEDIRQATEEYIVEDIMYNSSDDMDQLIDGENEDFNEFIGVAGMDNEELQEWYKENIVEENITEENSITSMLAKRISEPIIDLIATLVAVVILFFGTQIILSIVSFIINKFFDLPGLKTMNKALGVVLGIVLGLIRVCLFCFIMNILIENADFLGIDLISDIEPDSTLLFSIFRNINIFSFFI